VPLFCVDANGKPGAYKNAYDLGKAGGKRQAVDAVIEKVSNGREGNSGLKKQNIYFAAVETTGTGIRFFGDICLVMKYRPQWYNATSDTPLDPREQTVVLQHNSYDLVREPLSARIKWDGDTNLFDQEECEKIAAEWVGTWTEHLLDMVALRALRELPNDKRRWTSGEISSVILDDEDYTEVLYPCSFGATELMEARTSASDAAAEGDIADRERTGEAPGIHEMEWRQQRREARKALARAGIPLRVVTTTGRTKGS
jgi:hypothetical protein